MSNSNSNSKRPTFAGNSMSSVDINTSSLSHVGEEVTRRAASVMPSFAPISTSLDSSSLQRLPSAKTSASASPQGPSFPANSPKTRLGLSTHSPASKKIAWRLLEVPTLPEYHPLERTAVFIPQATPEEISSRVSSVLRERSIEAFYEDDKAKAKCTTEEGVEFRVRLYRGRGRFHHGIIVEVQRRFGASLSFHSDVTAILDAAEGKASGTAAATAASPSSSDFKALPLVSDSEEDSYQVNGASSLKMVSNMFRHQGYDSNYLAYQTLISLTDSTKMGMSTSKAVSTALLQDGNDVGSRVLALIVDKKNADAENDAFKLRSMALTVLANALLATNGQIIGDSEAVRDQLRPVLAKELREAHSSPRAAMQAARCVEGLCSNGDAASMDDARYFCQPLEVAHQAGSARHAGLMRQAQKCLDLIQ